MTASDGSSIFLVSRSNWGINVLVRPSGALRSTAVGLLGTVLPGGLGVPALPDGTRLPRANLADRLRAIYERLGPAWRVTSSTSLFDYEPGKTTDSYTIPGFPDLSVIRTPDDLTPTERDAGMSVCSGITDPDLQLQCIFDVVTSGIAAFADLYNLTDTFIRTGTDALQEPPPSSPPASATPRPSVALPAEITSLAGQVYLLRGRALASDGTLYVSLHNVGDTHELIAVDPATGQVKQRVAMAGSGEVAVAAGAVWVGELPDGYSCAIARVDPVSLATAATIPIACTVLGPTFAALGDELWFIDPTGVDINGKGAHLRRLDPATNKPDKAVDLPGLNGYLQSSGEALFYTTGDDTSYRLLPGASAFESIGTVRGVRFPAHDGIWTEAQDAAGNVAAFQRQAGAPASTLPIDGPLVGADANGVFVQLSDQGTSVLWHVDVAGNPVEVMRSQNVPTGTGTTDLSFFDDYAPLAQGNRVVKLWLIPSRSTPNASELLLGSALIP
jgi:hypothetical protein